MAWNEASTEAYQKVDVPAPVTAFGNTSDALERARALSSRVSSLVDRLCGTQPTEAQGTKLPGGGSVLSKLKEEAESAHDAISRAMRQLDRLERELP